MFLGGSCVNCCIFVDRSPSRALDLKTPEEMWSGNPPELGNLRTFGCATFAHQKDDKLSPRSRKCVFLGYGEGVKGLRGIGCGP